MESVNKIRCLIVDDEPLARDVLENFISKVDQLELIAKCSSADKAFNFLLKEKIDLIFLDIEMPDLTGVEFLKSLSSSPMVIFATAYTNFALEAYNLDVIDYLVKPIEFSRFLKSINKIFYRLDESAFTGISSFTYNHMIDKFIYLKEGRVLQKIYLRDILFIESIKNYINIATKERTMKVYKSISSIISELPNSNFLRVHRSFIINTIFVDSFSSSQITIRGNVIPIGRKYQNMVKDHLGYF